MAVLQKLRSFGLPLLMKELLEQSARRRTYVVRIAYAAMLFMMCLVFLLGRIPAGATTPLDQLGLGIHIYQDLVNWQFAGIYVFLPALVCGALTVEKEQNTLGLLFLTKLGPWTIVFEKLLSRMFPMSCLLLCSLPLMAFSYSLGGIETGSLFAGVWLLSVTMIQVATVSMACSAFCRTTTAALLSAYFVIATLAFGMAVADSVLLDNSIRQWFIQLMLYLEIQGPATKLLTPVPQHVSLSSLMFPFAGPVQFQILTQQLGLPYGPWSAFWMGVPSFVAGCVALILARVFIVRRAFVPPSNIALRVLRWVDGAFQVVNRRFGRGIEIFSEAHSIPDTAPIAWRETHKRALGQFRYLLRVFLLITIPTTLIVVMIIIQESTEQDLYQTSLTTVVPLLWLVTTLLVSVSSASLISGERSRQTLDVMLTAPMIGRQIIVEKLAGIKRLIWVCSVPLIACILFDAYWRESLGTAIKRGRSEFDYWEYLVTAFSMVWIYPRLTAWLSLWVGLKCKSATRATIIMLIVLVALCFLPIFAVLCTLQLIFPGSPGSFERNGFLILLQFSPMAMMVQSQFGGMREFSPIPYLPVIANSIWYGMWWLLIRWRVLRSADRLLGRTATPA